MDQVDARYRPRACDRSVFDGSVETEWRSDIVYLVAPSNGGGAGGGFRIDRLPRASRFCNNIILI